MPRLYAHRGAAAQEPENTLGSFERAVALGAHGLEMDLHMSRDGVVVVSHDPDGQRMCRRSHAIKRTSFAELSDWDAGWGFVDDSGDRPFVGRGYQIPAFADVLDAFPDQFINIDIKQQSPSMVGSVLRIINDQSAWERVNIASFSQTTLLHVRALGYKGSTGLGKLDLVVALYGPRILRHLPLRGGAAQIPTRHGRIELATAANIKRFHDQGLRVDFWTINDLEEARSLLALGADGIMTDDPKLIAPAFG